MSGEKNGEKTTSTKNTEWETGFRLDRCEEGELERSVEQWKGLRSYGPLEYQRELGEWIPTAHVGDLFAGSAIPPKVRL